MKSKVYKISNAVNNDIVKKTVYNEIVVQVNYIDTSGFVLKIQYSTDKSRLEKKIYDTEEKGTNIIGLVKKTEFSTKVAKKKIK